jgi:hypothetical protein
MNFKWFFILFFITLTCLSFSLDTGSLNVANGKFVIDSNGDITKVNNVVTNFPSSLPTGLSAISFGTQGNIIKVAKDGTGDFTTIASAIAATSSSSVTNRYTVLVYPGKYEITSQIDIRPYVSIVGIDKDQCFLYGNIDQVEGGLLAWTMNSFQFRVANLTLENTAVWTSTEYETARCIYVGSNAHDFKIENCNINSLYGKNAIQINGDSYNFYIENCNIQALYYPISVLQSTTGTQSFWIKNCVLTKLGVTVDNHAIISEFGTSGTFVNAYFINCEFKSPNDTTCGAFGVANKAKINLIDCSIENSLYIYRQDVAVANSTIYMQNVSGSPTTNRHNPESNGDTDCAITYYQNGNLGNTKTKDIYCNDIRLQAGGNITENGVNATREIILTASGALHSTTNGAPANVLIESATYKQNFNVVPFAYNTKKYIEWTIYLPINYSGESITGTVMWIPSATEDSTTIYGLDVADFTSGDPIDSPWNNHENEAADTRTANYIWEETSTIDEFATFAGHWVQVRFYYDGTAGEGVYSGTFNFVSLKLTYPINQYSNN